MKPSREVEALEELGTVPNYRDVFGDTKLRSFTHFIEERIAINEHIKALEEEKKDIDKKLTALMLEHDAIKVNYEGRNVSLVEGTRTSLNKEKLLLAGVPATTIVAATDTSHFTYLLVGKEKA